MPLSSLASSSCNLGTLLWYSFKQSLTHFAIFSCTTHCIRAMLLHTNAMLRNSRSRPLNSDHTAMQHSVKARSCPDSVHKLIQAADAACVPQQGRVRAVHLRTRRLCLSALATYAVLCSVLTALRAARNAPVEVLQLGLHHLLRGAHARLTPLCAAPQLCL